MTANTQHLRILTGSLLGNPLKNSAKLDTEYSNVTSESKQLQGDNDVLTDHIIIEKTSS